MPKKRSGLKLFIGFVGSFFIIIGGILYYKAALKRSPSKNSEMQKFMIEQGQGVAETAQKLEDEGLINSSNLFKIYLRLNNLAGNLQAGEYSIPKNLNLIALVDMLQHGTFAKKITIIEGLRREEVAEVFEKELSIAQSEFLYTSDGLEGRLFPETYFFEKDTTVQDIVGKMFATFENKLTSEIQAQARVKGLSEDELIIMASIVEREVATEADRAIVAGILIKRWEADWPLQADATVQYAMGTPDDWWPKSLNADNLDTDSPFNTRKNPGLPPSPICSPSLSSIKATANCVETVYWYYLTDEDGVTHYAETLDEHNDNIEKYL
jgi:UPF0755 protein